MPDKERVSSRQTLASMDCLLLERSQECEITTDRDARATQLNSCYETTATTPRDSSSGLCPTVVPCA
jgi:hypothetical protein